jgi:hypothetical protein
MNARLHLPSSQNDSWLALVAETAGVGDCGIARVCLALDGRPSGELRAVVQVQDAQGRVLGAAEFFGLAEDFRSTLVDVGYSGFSPKKPLRLVAWLAGTTDPAEPEVLIAPSHASVGELREVVALKLILGPEAKRLAA